MAKDKEETKTNWEEWIQNRIGSGSEAPQKANLDFGRIAWCNAFDRGDQYKILNELTGMVEDVYTSRETRCIYNFCKTFNDAYASKMWKGDPIPIVAPYSTNTEDYDEDLSVSTNGMVEYWWKTASKAGMILRDTTRTAAVGGIGIVKIYYDKNKKSGIYLGEVVVEKVNPLHFYANVDATNDDEFREIIHRFPKEKSVAEEEFSEQMKKLGIKELEPHNKEDANPETIQASKKIGFSVSDEVESTVIVNDIWIKSNKKYPKHWVDEKDNDGKQIFDKDGKPKRKEVGGRHVIQIGKHTLIEEDNEEPDKVPFFAYPVNPVDGKLIGLGITYPILPIQRDANKSSSVVMENIDFMGHLKWMYKEGSLEHDGVLDDFVEKVQYSGDTAPHQSEVKPLPIHITGKFWDLLEVAKFVTHIQNLGLGILPKRGSQMAMGTTQELVGSEEVMFAPDKARMVDFISRIIRRYLFLAKKYFKEERIITVIGENKRPEAISFLAQKLKDDYNVDIKVGAGFSKSDEAKTTAITNLMQTGAFDKSGVDPRLVMEELLKMNGLTKLKEDTFKDERQAKRYLSVILAGGKPTASKFINPNAHLKVVGDYIKQPQYDVLPLDIKTEIDKYMEFLVSMTIGQSQPPMPGAIGTPGNEPPAPPNPNEIPNVGGRPPMAPPENTRQAEMAPQGV